MMDIRQPNTTTEALSIIGIVYYYRDMWTRRYQILATLTEASRGPKYRKYFGMTHNKSYLRK